MWLQHRWALWSGFLGASASCLIKMALSSSSGPVHYFETHICQQHCPWIVDLDDTVLAMVYKVLGHLMIRHRINFMPYFTTFRKVVETHVIMRLRIFEVDYCHVVTLPIQALCIVAMVVANAYMIASFLKGMQASGSVVAPSLSTAANFTTSAIYGALVWGEQMNTQWCVGFVCVLLGVFLLSNTLPVEGEGEDSIDERTNEPMGTNVSETQQRRLQHPKTVIKTLPPQLERGKVASMASKYKKNDPSPNAAQTPINRPTRRFKMPPSPKDTVPKATAASPIAPAITNNKPASNIKTNRASLKAESALKQYYRDDKTTMEKPHYYDPRLVYNNFLNQCALCEETIFDTTTGESISAVADLSPHTCFHIYHAKCLKQSTKAFCNTCPLCGPETPLGMWTTAKQAAHFPGFWLPRVEQYLLSTQRQPQNNGVDGGTLSTCLPASEIRTAFWNDPSLTPAQKAFVSDDPTGMGKGLQAALEWGGYRDYNTVPKGHIGFHDCLRTRGIWKYDAKKDDIWLWSWGDIHPRQRCDQCQMIQKQLTLPVQCPVCVGSSEAARYCSLSCSKRDWQRHKQICQQWKDKGPACHSSN